MTDSSNTRTMSRRNFTKNAVAASAVSVIPIATVAMAFNSQLVEYVAAYRKAEAEYEQAQVESNAGDAYNDAAEERMAAAMASANDIGKAIAATPAHNLCDLSLKAGIISPAATEMIVNPYRCLSGTETIIFNSLCNDITALAAAA